MFPHRQSVVRVVRGCSILVIAIGWFAVPITGRDREVPVKWEDLAGVVLNRSVSLALPDGAIVEGKVVGVQDDALNLRIRKSSDSRFRRDSTAAIPRASVRVLQTEEISGPWRAIGAAALGGAGAVGGWAIAEGVFHVSGEGSGVWSEPQGPALVLGLGGGLAVVGYLAGRASDRHVTYFKIVP